jgi:hypothetical protein
MNPKIAQLKHMVWTDTQGCVHKLNDKALALAERTAQEQPHLSASSLVVRALNAANDTLDVELDRI